MNTWVRNSGGAPLVAQGGGGSPDNPIVAARRTDWSHAGTTIETGRPKHGSTITAYSGTSGTIHTALAAASHDTYVELGSGTFTLSNALNLNQGKRVTLRGQGPGVTILAFTGDGSSAWPFGGASAPVSICGSPAWNADATPTTTGAAAGSVACSGTHGNAGVYAQGATVLNLGAHSFVVGDSGVLTQDNYTSGTLPRAGFFGSSKTDQSGSTANGISWQGAYEDFGACLQQRFVVTNVSGNDITIYPPLAHGFYETGRSPRVYRFAASVYATGIGLENLTIDTTALGTENALIGCCRAKEFWIKGVAIVPNATAGGDYGIAVSDCFRFSIVNNWIDTLTGGGIFTTTSYGVSIQGSHWGLVANNILNEVESPLTINIGVSGCVLAYNFELNIGGEGGIDHHQPGCCYNLYEGNSVLKFTGDLFHGNSMVMTAFRNHCFDRGFDLQSYHRFWNMLGNVLHATAVRKTVGTEGTSGYNRWAGFGFRLGYNGQNADTNNFYNGAPNIGVATDIDVSTTAFIWGNYTTTGGTQFNSSEVPTSDATLPQTVPPDNNLPNSMYYTSRPGFFTISGIGTIAWPPIGPDVTGGDFEGGRAYKIPAQRVFESVSGNVANFNPSVYG